jgi:hypothetical protein
MASTAQTNANHANAQHSTGPRTPEGKARVAQNAVRHGLTAKHLIVRPDEQEEFADVHQSLLDELQPHGALEHITFQELLHAAWNLRRFRRLEAERFNGGDDPLTDPDFDAFLDRLGRYQARTQRAYYRALRELRTLQTERALRAEELDPECDAVGPPMASVHDLTKQTQTGVQGEAVKIALNLLDQETDLLLATSRARRIAQLEQHNSQTPAENRAA